jgi:hypothetical protein
VTAPPDHGVVLRAGAAELRRSLRPVVWLVLEDLALQAVTVDGALVASTSARAIAQRLGLDPATAASALRTLRDRSLVELTRTPGPSGRFGLSVYRLARIPGIDVVAPCGIWSDMAASGTVDPDADMGSLRTPRRRVQRSSVIQGAFDLGLDSR